MRDVTVALGGAAAALRDPAAGEAAVVLDISPQHPSAHGALRLRLRCDGDVIHSAEPEIGFLHRGTEKLFEVRDYRQIMVLANRHDWLSAFSSELGVALAVERMLGLEVPVRATWLRTLLAELNRIASHLLFLAAFPVGMAGSGAATMAHAGREAVQTVLEEATGGRVHYMANRVGGLRQEVPLGWAERVRDVLGVLRGGLPALDAALDAEAVRGPTVGVGVLTRESALQYGVSGPLARASGLDLDLRRDDPYLAYGELSEVLRVITATEGDCHARARCLAEQVAVSLDLADACLDRVATLTGPVDVRLPKTVRAPEGHLYLWTENPLGINGYYLVSRGERTPWRLKMRTASFNNVQVLRAMLPGTTLDQLVPILGSLFFVVGDIDK